MRRIAQSYAGCSSYQDTGVVETTFDETTSGRIEKKPFKTYFQRPTLFRFEWIDYSPYKDGRLNIVWSNGKEAFTYWQPDRYEKEESLSMGIAGATGISSGAAHTLSRLLMEDIMSGFALTDLTDLSIVGSEQFEGEWCYRISGKHPSGSLYELWIGKSDYLVRKLRRRSKFENFSTLEEEIHRDIKINVPIARSVFNFKPPIALTPREDPQKEETLLGNESPTWSEFHSVEGRFKVLLPTKPKTQTLSLETPQGRITHYGFTAAQSGVICIIEYADLPKQLATPDNIKVIFDEVRDQLLKTVEGKLANESVISLDAHPGREIKIDLRGGSARARFYMVNERLYQLAFMEITFSGKPSSAMDKFFDSFKLVADSKSVAILSPQSH
jgi:outer membrane lipoprotein-sorting protein